MPQKTFALSASVAGDVGAVEDSGVGDGVERGDGFGALVACAALEGEATGDAWWSAVGVG